MLTKIKNRLMDIRGIKNLEHFDNISLSIASPDRIHEWSHGEVTKPETINYRTGRSERQGLFDERIFGPEKDYECYCKKYRGIKYKDITCEKCGVEVTRSVVRRERMGHIDLASPVAHIWFLRGVPSRMSMMLGISVADLEKVIYFAGYIITKVYDSEKQQILKDLDIEYKSKVKVAKNEDTKDQLKELLDTAKKELAELQTGVVLSEAQYHHVVLRYSSVFEANIGAEAIYNLFKGLDLPVFKEKLEKEIESANSIEKVKLKKRISLVRSMMHAKVRPEWMFMTTIPVIPPALRPMVALDGGRHATSDLNDLYRRVINRNNRLKKLKGIGAPDVILRNEKRIMQEAVDALIDNSIAKHGDSAMNQAQRRALKSLADNLKSKQGLFRQNLLGKRVDYSGRSVIVVGASLKMNQCGIPKRMAMELFRPFVIGKVLERELAFNIRGANKLIEDGVPEVWAILEEVIEGKYVLLNRAPTLHRLGIQAFNPILIEGKAIQLHPLTCSAFNADFDGDQMAVHVPLSDLAQAEARDLMAADKNLLKPQDGTPIVSPVLDMVLGCYWMTKDLDKEKGEGMYFSSPNEAMAAYDYGVIDFRAKINVKATDSERYAQFNEGIFETSVGRLFFNSVLPKDFPYINEEMTKKRLSDLVDQLIAHYGIADTPKVLDAIKRFGYQYSTKSGTTWSIDNVNVPEEKDAIIAKGRAEDVEIRNQFNEGLLSEDEKYRKIISLWDRIKNEIQDVMVPSLDKRSSTYDMITSGARGALHQITQMAGMKGTIVNTQGRPLEFPIVRSYKEGLSPIDYFITTHGSRKGLADTALKTAQAGYLTRRLVDVAQDVVINEEDCKTKDHIVAKEENISGLEIPLSKNIYGRTAAKSIETPDGKTLYKKGTVITKEIAKEIEDKGIIEVAIHTPLTCALLHGVCRKCYGLDLARGENVKIGEAIGIIAAQAIGEPGTQLTLRTFHQGGVAGGADITQGLPRVEEVFDRRTPKNPATVNQTNGVVVEVKEEEGKKTITVLSETKVKGTNTIIYVMQPHRISVVSKGQEITPGQLLTDGSANLQELFKYGGQDMAEQYVINEINKVYQLQGAPIAKKHLEVIVKQMFSRRLITESGDSSLSVGTKVESIQLHDENEKIKKDGGVLAEADVILLGITQVSLSAKSWLSAASFQNTSRVLIANAVKRGVDDLRGLKENVIIGRLIPAGTGIRKKVAEVEDLEENE
ncbi:MAG: DNA-directed RNA polymerase subunit beta' [Candidatus Paceibacteria bacterium]|jgi:DNA-directed RNA polymerase subunit beta'